MQVPVLQLVQILLKHFGSQGWWPTTPSTGSHPQYHAIPKTKDFTESERFEICVGALLTQNTAWTNVEKALAEMHRARVLNPKKIGQAPFTKMAQCIRSSGYFRQKTKKLKLFSNYLMERYHGKVTPLLKKPLMEARIELLGLYGFGPETVDSILLYAAGKPIFVVDAYTRRIGTRIGLFQNDHYEEIQKFFQKNLPRSVSLYNETHALFVALGKNICKTKPFCDRCPLQRVCRTGLKRMDTGTTVKGN